MLGELTEKVMNSSFRKQINDGNIIFRHVNIDLQENSDVVSRFGPTSSSVMIGYSDKTGFHAENQIQLWYKLGDKKAFGEELSRAIIDRMTIYEQ